MRITDAAQRMIEGIEPPNIQRNMGQVNIATVVESDIYSVISKSTTIVAVAISPTLQSRAHIADRQTRNPLPPLNPYHTGKECPIIAIRQVKVTPRCHSPQSCAKT